MIEQKMATNNLIYKARLGSDLYGTVTEESDEDFGGIFIPDKDYVIGIKKCEQVALSEKISTTQRNQRGDVDYTIYSLPKFIKLAINNNPNIIEFFFAHETCILECNEFGKQLIESYPLFISKKSYHTFKGYSYSQRKKLEDKNIIKLFKNRISKKVYKYSSHLIRLLLEGQQLLIEGKLTLPLPQNNLIRDIKIGRYDLNWILNKAEELENLVDLAYTNSKLQYSADLKAINKLQIEILEGYWDNEQNL